MKRNKCGNEPTSYLNRPPQNIKGDVLKMEQKTNKSKLKIIIPIAIVILAVIGIVIFASKYFALKKELAKYEDIYSMLKEENLTISGEDVISILELKNAELKEETIKYKNKYDEIYSILVETQNKLEEYQKNTTNNSQVIQERQHYIFRRGNYNYSKRCQ